MSDEFVLYDGRMVSKENFRVFVYGLEGAQKVVNSWLEYEAAMASGLWFPSKDEVAAMIDKKQPQEQVKNKRK